MAVLKVKHLTGLGCKNGVELAAFAVHLDTQSEHQ